MIINPARSALTALSLSLSLLAGCAAPGTFPSLAPRPYELGQGAKGAETPVTPPQAPATPSDPRLLARIAASVAKAESGEAGFRSALADAERAVASGGRSMGSDSWIAAQMAVSRLERARGVAEAAMSDLDGEQRVMLGAMADGDRAALLEAMARVGGINADQSAHVARLVNAISPR